MPITRGPKAGQTITPIQNFCWQRLSPVAFKEWGKDATAARLLSRLSNMPPKPHVLWFEEAKFSAVVVPDFVTSFLTKFDFPPEMPVTGTGLLDILKCNQMNVSADMSASIASSLAAAHGLVALTTVDDKSYPVGVFFPTVVAEHLPNSRRLKEIESEKAGRDIQLFLRQGNLPRAIAIIEASIPNFLSEGLNFATPDPLVCDGEGGHVVAQCPCRAHPSAGCSRKPIK